MEIRTIHSKAMDLAERAMVDRAHGRADAANRLLRDALDLEESAARMVIAASGPEPTRTILLKSAAHLAIGCGELRRAERLIATALAGEPPEELARELRRLFEEVGFHHHLDLQGCELHRNDVQMVLVGRAIAPGMAASDEFVGRVRTLQSLLYRTSESDRGVEYRERGDPSQLIEKPLQLYISVPRAASFAVSLKVASQKGQAEFEFAESAEVLDRLLDRLALFDREEFEKLRSVIPKQEYFDNFMRLAGELAPDGERVRLVGFTARHGDAERRLEMKRAETKAGSESDFAVSDRPQSVQGRVFFVNTKDQDNPIIKLEVDGGKDLRLRADGNLLQKAVKHAATGGRVRVVGIQVSKTIMEVHEFKALRRPRLKKAKRRSKKPR